MKRLFDFTLALVSIIIVLPVLLLIALAIWIEDKGSVVFIQERVGQKNKNFYIYKFRTMGCGSSPNGHLTVGHDDVRVTKTGKFLRRYKLDELPQLINIVKGDMSFVGPRPELRHYVNFYKEADYEIFQVKPGLTGLASLKFFNEAELLNTVADPEAYYIATIIPNKLAINKHYIKTRSFVLDVKILWFTFIRIMFNN